MPIAPLSSLMPIVPLFAVDMFVVLDTCHAVEGVAKVGAQSSVLQLRYKAYSIFFLPASSSQCT
jgi:hypothetical protein